MKILAALLLLLTNALYGQTFVREVVIENFDVTHLAFSQDGKYLLVSDNLHCKVYSFPGNELIHEHEPNDNEWWFQDPTFDPNTKHLIFTIDLLFFHLWNPLTQEIYSGEFTSYFFAAKGGSVSTSLKYAYTLGNYNDDYPNFLLWKRTGERFNVLEKKTGVLSAKFLENFLFIKRKPPGSEEILEEMWDMRDEETINIDGELTKIAPKILSKSVGKKTKIKKSSQRVTFAESMADKSSAVFIEAHHPTQHYFARSQPIEIFKSRIEIWQDSEP